MFWSQNIVFLIFFFFVCRVYRKFKITQRFADKAIILLVVFCKFYQFKRLFEMIFHTCEFVRVCFPSFSREIELWHGGDEKANTRLVAWPAGRRILAGMLAAISCWYGYYVYGKLLVNKLENRGKRVIQRNELPGTSHGFRNSVSVCYIYMYTRIY